MTQGRREELERLYYFFPDLHKRRIIKPAIRKYFEWSEQGKHKKDVKKSHFKDGFNALVAAKQWCGRTIHELYEPGILSGDMPYAAFIEKTTPRVAIEFIKREMFKGIDSQIIENYYQTLWS